MPAPPEVDGFIPNGVLALHLSHLQVITAVAAIEFSTRYSKACCQLMVENGGVTALLEFMRSCNRSKPHMEMLGHALACLANICRCVRLHQIGTWQA
jgi:hypothetical protein